MSYLEQAPRIVELGRRVPVFEFPLDSRNDYSYHLSLNPGVSSALLLKSGFLPDLRLFSIVQSENREDSVGRFWIEADKDHLGKLGMLEVQRYIPGGIPLPMRPAVFGASRWAGYYILDEETLDKIGQLSVHLFLPEGEFIAHPNINTRKGSTSQLTYATGIKFDQFREAHGRSTQTLAVSVDLKDEASLREFDLMFTSG